MPHELYISCCRTWRPGTWCLAAWPSRSERAEAADQRRITFSFSSTTSPQSSFRCLPSPPPPLRCSFLLKSQVVLVISPDGSVVGADTDRDPHHFGGYGSWSASRACWSWSGWSGSVSVQANDDFTFFQKIRFQYAVQNTKNYDTFEASEKDYRKSLNIGNGNAVKN